MQLILDTSDYFPLMSKKMYEKWYQTRVKGLIDSEFIDLGKKMYGNDDDGGMYTYESVEIPKGLMVLAALMTASSKDLFCLELYYEAYLKSRVMGQTSINVGAPLGCGTHAIVFERHGFDDQIVKVANYGIAKD